jgi:hypothetical protein
MPTHTTKEGPRRDHSRRGSPRLPLPAQVNLPCRPRKEPNFSYRMLRGLCPVFPVLSESVLAVIQWHPFALRQDVSFQRAQALVVGIHGLALDGILDAPLDHVAQQRHPL